MDDSMIITEKVSKARFRRRQERERYHTTSIDHNTINEIKSSMTATTGSGKLAQEIHDEFLTCKICLEGYKSPKCLDCLHTFCEGCIDNHVMSECTYKKYSDYREFTCPLCRKRTQLPIGGVKKLPDNFLVSNLSELVVRQRPSKFPFCDICKLVNRKHREAASKCLDCNKLLCKPCVELHRETKVTKNHSIFDCEIEKDIECKEHKEEAVRFYCEPCETCICVLCTFNEHKDHEITSFTDAVVKYKENIQTLLDNCKSKIDLYDIQLVTLGKCESLIKAAEQQIRDTAIQFIADVRSREKELIDDLHQLYGAELMKHVDQRNELQVNLDAVKSTCSLTELVLKGKDIELLLLKKQVQEKLTALNDIELNSLPETVGKQVCFIPGNLDLGTLEDAGTPRQSMNRQLSMPGTMRKGGMRSACVQTEKEEPLPKTKQIDEETQTEAEQKEKDDEGSEESDSVFSNVDDKSTETEAVETSEKGVNTRSRSLVHSVQSSSSQDNPSEGQNGFQDAPSSPVGQRRHRRRRERSRQEVSAPMTATITNVEPQAPPVSRAPVLSYSSSIDDNYMSPTDGGTSVTPGQYKSYSQFGPQEKSEPRSTTIAYFSFGSGPSSP
ncbi:E3 ubiquitin-protein ligase TRIM56-like isoform X4 [Ruditapes philippinarum]|uniref:E3 ubiquitin-protein ligase TRIM56-like isoform X4 n=1 Tax=Ruditapes philippinarum TaxID=129788 RepID=UPI00295B72FC|nr:E3 ubiquitin-protein ligase TRIM56-like isoform X4 [Ruditapes philippinarum]